MPCPTSTPTSSRRPFPKIPSTASNEKNPTHAALEFMRSAFSTNPNVAGSIVGMIGGGGTPGGELAAFATFAASFLLFSSIAAPMDSMGPARVATTPPREEDAVREEARRAAVKVRVGVVSGARRTCIVKSSAVKCRLVTSSPPSSIIRLGFVLGFMFHHMSRSVHMFNAMSMSKLFLGHVLHFLYVYTVCSHERVVIIRVELPTLRQPLLHVDGETIETMGLDAHHLPTLTLVEDEPGVIPSLADDDA